MNVSVRSNIISGIIAAAIFAIVAAATGGSAAVVIGGALALGVVTFVISYLITKAIAAGRSRA
jgi:hypothetical protein